MIRKIQQVITVAAMFAMLFSGKTALYSQTHVSVPVDNPVYYILDQAEVRGLCSPLPAVKPYTRGKILEVINEILDAEYKTFGNLTDGEREILETIRAEFGRKAAGFDPWKGMHRFDADGKKSVRFSGELGIAGETLNSAAYYKEQEKKYIGTDTWGTFFFRGDVGEHFSFNLDFSAGMMKAQRVELGEYYPYATEANASDNGIIVDEPIITNSQPLAFFPYSYQKKWDGFMFGLGGPMTAGNMEGWPNKISIAASMESELSASAFDDMLLIRFGRIRREWGSMAPGSSLVLNGAARPFVGIETGFTPVPWFTFSSITGVLEFDNTNGISEPAMTFQNAYSLQQIELNYKNYFHIDFGSSSVWSKRFELGYIFPLLDNFFYQNYIGDFDNMAIHINLKGQFPGLGKVWFSYFMDELEISSMGSAFDRDRHMFAYQVGAQGSLNRAFTSITVSYTKIEPYNYTHRRNILPWYGDSLMELAYVNSGACLGYYLPPNSDEIKVRFDTRSLPQTICHFQYQLIRHGADYGPHQVDGSSLVSELDNKGRSEKASLKKNFLNDGAYQWTHIFKIGAEYKFKKLPLTFFGETGVVYSYFTDVSDEEYAKYTPTPEGQTPRPPAAGSYFKSTAFILTLGFKLFK